MLSRATALEPYDEDLGATRQLVHWGEDTLFPSLPVDEPQHNYKMLTWRKLGSLGKITASNERFFLAGCQSLAFFSISLCMYWKLL